MQMHLSDKLVFFSQLVAAFMLSTSNFEDFEKKENLHSLCSSKTADCERRG